MRTVLSSLLVVAALVAPVWAADIEGNVTDRTGGVLPGATVRLLNVTTGQQITVTTDGTGRFQFQNLNAGIYRLSTEFVGFSDASRTVIVEDAAQSIDLDFELELGSVHADITVSAARGERDVQVVPLRIDTIHADTLKELAPVSTGDVLGAAPGVTIVGSGPFQMRPRLRGLDSTRVLVLVDGERLNNARTATDRAGVEVGLVDVAAIETVEVLGGAGSVLYGTDALSGTINIITNRPRFTDGPRFTAGFDGLYSSNENGRRGSVVLGASDRRWAVSFTGTAERYDDYSAGKDFNESSVPFFTEGVLHQDDSVDTFFGFNFGRFPDPFNAPFTRTRAEIPSSGMEASAVTAAGILSLTSSQTLEMKYQRRRAEDVGFPDFADPFFFQSITLPWSRLDKFSATYSATNLRPWLSRLTATTYYQQHDRLLRNQLPAQFAAPAVTFFPVTVFKLNILSDTRQQVWTPGVDVQATFLPRPNNVLTAGITVFRDRSEDERTTSTETTQIGQVALAGGRPTAVVFPSPIVLGPPAISHPVRVPNASFRDVGLFVHDEWDVTPIVRLTGGLRIDRYRVVTDQTEGYDIASLVAGATPAIDPSTLPTVDGDRISRTAVTGEAGLVVWSSRPVSLFAHYVRSYRHPNLEELLFSGPATAGNIVPNVQVEPERGHNIDTGVRFRASRVSGSLSYFNNTYDDFISTEIVATRIAQGRTESISQAINLAKVRIQGVEIEGNAPIVFGGLNWLPHASVAYNRGTVLEGAIPQTGLSLAGEPQDNITPWKILAGLRVSDQRERWWGSYGVRTVTDVTRISPLLSESEFLIAQDLLGLSGFSVHRVSAGYDWRRNSQVLGLSLVVDNLANTFYREQFQFAPARGRSVSLLMTVRGGR